MEGAPGGERKRRRTWSRAGWSVPTGKRSARGSRGGRCSDARRGADRPRRGRAGPAGRGTGQRRCHSGRGHQAGPPSRRHTRRPADRARGLLLRRGRGAPRGRAGRRAPGRAERARGHRRRHAGHQRPGLPACRRGSGGRDQGHRGARAVSSDHRPCRFRTAHRQVLFRGVSAAQGSRAGAPVRGSRGRYAYSGVLRVAAPASQDPRGAAALTRRRPGRGRLPGADQGPRGDQARHAGGTRGMGRPGKPGAPARVRRRPGRNHAGRGRRQPCRRQGRRPGIRPRGPPRRPPERSRRRRRHR